jgi:chloramphenicol O-acetyltransferase type B
MIIDRVAWLARSLRLKSTFKGFWASPYSYATKDVEFAPYVRLYGSTTLSGTSVGRHTYFYNCKAANLTIGCFCSVGPGSRLGGMGTHPLSMISTHPAFFSTRKQSGRSFVKETYFLEYLTTHIGNDVWVGANAIVIDGITIGDGAVIAAGAVVTTDVPAYAIVGGVPAKVIRYRFSPVDVETLLRVKWWLQPDEILMSIAAQMRNGDVSKLAAALGTFETST